MFASDPDQEKIPTPITASSPLVRQTTHRVTPPNSGERPMKRKRSTPARLDPNGGEKKRKAPSKQTTKKRRARGRGRKHPVSAVQKKMKTTPSPLPNSTYGQDMQAPPMTKSPNSTVDTSGYSVVMGQPVLPGSGGVKYELTHSAGLVFRGPCDAKTTQYLKSTDELCSSPLEFGSEVVGVGETHCNNAPLHSALKSHPGAPPPSESWTSTPRTRTLFDLPLSPPPSVAQRASLSTSPWYAQSMTPQRHCIAVPMTPSSMPAVTTPKRLTDSAKAFADALHESSPLAMLASAAGMESDCVMGGTYAPHPDATPALVESGPSGATPTELSKEPMPLLPVSMPPMGSHGSSPKDAGAVGSSKGVRAVNKRYNIRPKEGCRTEIGAATASTSAVDLLFERPTQHPTFFTGSVLRAPRSTLPLLGGTQFTSGTTA